MLRDIIIIINLWEGSILPKYNTRHDGREWPMPTPRRLDSFHFHIRVDLSYVCWEKFLFSFSLFQQNHAWCN